MSVSSGPLLTPAGAQGSGAVESDPRPALGSRSCLLDLRFVTA
jgi:hypothetical protein